MPRKKTALTVVKPELEVEEAEQLTVEEAGQLTTDTNTNGDTPTEEPDELEQWNAIQLDMTGEGQPLEDPTPRYARNELIQAQNLISKKALHAMAQPDVAKSAIEDAMKMIARAIQYLNVPDEPRYIAAIAAAATANHCLLQARRCLDPKQTKKTVEDIFLPLAKSLENIKQAKFLC